MHLLHFLFFSFEASIHLFYNLISSSQHLPIRPFSLNLSFYYITPLHTLCVLSLHSRWTIHISHISLGFSIIARFSCSHICSTLLSSSYSTLLFSRQLAYPSSSLTHACACIYLRRKWRCTLVKSTISTGLTVVPVARRFETTGPPLRLQPSSAFVTVVQSESVRPLTPPFGISSHIYSSSHHPHSR